MSKISCRNTHSQNMVSCLLLGLLWTWNWIVYQSPTDLLISIGEWRFPSRSLLLASFAVAGFFFFFTNRRSKKSASKRTRYFAGIALGLTILLTDVLDGSFDGELEGTLFAIQSVAMGTASAFLYTEIGRLFAQTELRKLKSISAAAVAALALCVPLQIILYYTQGNAREGLMVLFLAACSPAIDTMQPRKEVNNADRHDGSIPVPIKFSATLALFGIALGMLQGVFTQITSAEGHGAFNPLSAVGFLIAAGIAAVGMFKGKLDFNQLIYQISMPILALGFTLVALNGDAFAGFALCVAGYYAAQIVLWVLCAHLTSQSKGIEQWLFPLMGSITTVGQAAGLLAIDTILYGRDHEASIIMSTLLLLACLFLNSSTSPYKSWGFIKPTDSGSRINIDEACEIIGIDFLLTAREKEILPHLARGRSRRAIAESLVLSENTIKTYTSNIYAKLNVHTRQEIIDLVQEKGKSIAEEKNEWF